MKLHIIGPGVVGKATGEGVRRFGHDIIYTDKGDPHWEVEANIHFICTPEEVVENVVDEMLHRGTNGECRDIVIRSSVPPGTTAYLAEKYKRLARFWHNPEFLREAVAEQDFLNTGRAIIGLTDPYYAGLRFCALRTLYEQMLVPIYFCSSTESELVKLITNAYLATQVSFWNAMESLCERERVNSHALARLVALDPRVSKYGAFQHGQPYGGRCLPKDVQQLIDRSTREMSDGHDWSWVTAHFLKGIQRVNRSLGGE